MYSLYVHIPFCAHRCAYCDFNTYAGRAALIPAYVDALRREIEAVSRAAGRRLPAHTVFFGGGTPSLLAPRHLIAILEALRAAFDLSPDAEITLEANPGTVRGEALRRLREAGFNRISFGMQSAHPDDLRLLERIHDFSDVVQAVTWARRAGFTNINLDLIYGLPEQPLERWQESLRRAVDLRPQHLSLYALTIERGTPFGRWAARGLLPLPDPDLAAEMYEWAEEFLAAQGYEHYEISNWALSSPPSGAKRSRGASGAKPVDAQRRDGGEATFPAFACRHNLQYWLLGPYLGFGAGAHGFAGGLRVANVSRLRTYLRRMEPPATPPPFPLSPATVHRRRIRREEAMREMMLLGLRLTRRGVPAADFRARFGREMGEVFASQIDELLRLGLLEWARLPDGETLRLTPRGRLLGNQVFMRFV